MATDHIFYLPVDILVNIFKKLKISDLPNVMLTCKTFRNIIKNDNILWKSLSRGVLIIHGNSITSKSVIKDWSWYNLCRISDNWRSGYYRSTVVLDHYINYMPWIKHHNSTNLFVTVGSELRCYPTNKRGLLNYSGVWKLEIPKVPRRDMRTNDISRFIIKNNILVCGNRDGCVAVYMIHNKYKKPRLQQHIKDCHANGLAEVTAVEFIEERNQLIVISGSYVSRDILLCNMRISDEHTTILHDNQTRFTNVPIFDGVGTKCLALNSSSNKLAIGLNGNSKPLLLDVNNNQYLLSAPNTMNNNLAIRDIQWHNENTIVYVTHSGHLQLIDTRLQQVVYNVTDPFQSTLYCVKSDGGNAIIAGSSQYSRCVLFDVRRSPRHVQMYFTQKKASPVYCLDFDASKLITAVDRGVAVLNFNIDPATATEGQRDYCHVFD